MNMNADSDQPAKKSPTLRQLLKSILGAALGVQGSETYERDFKQTSPWAYIVGGIIFGVIFVVTLVVVVNIVLS